MKQAEIRTEQPERDAERYDTLQEAIDAAGSMHHGHIHEAGKRYEDGSSEYYLVCDGNAVVGGCCVIDPSAD